MIDQHKPACVTKSRISVDSSVCSAPHCQHSSLALQAFQQELGARATTVAFVQKSAKEIISKSEGDTSNLQSDLIELSSAWDRVCKLSVSKQERLEQAHKLVSGAVYIYIASLNYCAVDLCELHN